MICSTACSVACISTQLKDYFILEFFGLEQWCRSGKQTRSGFLPLRCSSTNPVVQNWPIYQSKYLFVLKGRIRYNLYLFWNSIKMIYLDISNWICAKSWTDKQSGLMVPKVILNYQRNEFDAKKNLKRSKSCKLYIASRDHQWSQ